MITSRSYCHWCGGETFPSAKVGSSHQKCATVDHVRSKPECLSGKEYRNHKNKVNACRSCNQRRSDEWVAKFNAGLVFPTEWSLKQGHKEARRRAKKKINKERQEYLKNCKPCRVIHIAVPQELEDAFK